MRKKLLVVALIVIIAVSVAAYARAAYEGARTERNQGASSEATSFKTVVNPMSDLEVLVHVDISDGVTKEEAEQIAEATFIQVMGENVAHQLDVLTFDDTQIRAHFTWGYDENDMGHVFYMNADLTMLQITVFHCF